MKMNAEDLLDRYQKGECSPSELALLESWYLELRTKPNGLNEQELDAALMRIGSRLPLQDALPVKVLSWPKIAIAASLLLTAGFSYYFFADKLQHTTPTAQLAAQIFPGGNKAVLTLADGKEIVLDAMAQGKLADQAGNMVRKTTEGMIRYDGQELPGQLASGKIVYNTVRTPLGGQFQLILSDGTRVWLNAGSSIRYPAAFSGNIREVFTTGEVYFEVSKLKNKPFRVQSAEQVVEVLGTHFDINAYADEAQISTTLIEGSVKVSAGGKSKMIIPGEQAQVKGNDIQVGKVDSQDIVAWKNGLFSFERADVQTVMRQISRWYDVKVLYEGAVPKVKITGKVYRNADLGKSLEILTLLDIRYRINERTITILSN